MARPLRIEYPDAFYFVSVNARQGIAPFSASDKDYLLFLLNKICLQFYWKCYGFVVSDNSYRLMIQTPSANLAQGMRELNGIFTQFYNRQNHRTGSVLKGRYKAIVVDDKDINLLRALTQQLFSLLHCQSEADPANWKWSHAPAVSGRTWAPRWLPWHQILGWYATESGEARRRFINSISSIKVADSLKDKSLEVKQQLFIGSNHFIKTAHLQHLNYKSRMKTQQKSDKSLSPEVLWQQLLRQNDSRNAAIRQLYATGRYGLEQIGGVVSLHYSTISRIVNGSKALYKNMK